MSRFAKVMIVLLTIAAMATPAIAADDYKFSVYGSARTATYYNDMDTADTTAFTMDALSTSRFGLKASKGAVSGQYELSATSGGLRLIYGAYKFDGGTFSVGQQYNAFTPASFSKINVKDGGGLHWGFVGYTAREVSLKVALDNGFTFAAVRNSTQANGDVVLPKLEASYTGKAGDFSYVAAIGYKDHALNADDSIDAYLASFVGNIPAGPVAIKFNVVYGQNAGEYNLGTDSATNAVQLAGSVADDAEILSGFVQGSIKANASNLITAGVAYATEEAGALETDRMALFVQDQITIAPGFTVSPEIVLFDFTDIGGVDGADDEQLYVGAKWQVNF